MQIIRENNIILALQHLCLSILFYVLDQIDSKAGGRYHQRCSGGAGVCDLFSLSVLEAVGSQQLVGLVKIINVHSDSSNVLGYNIGIGNVHMEAVLVLH